MRHYFNTRTAAFALACCLVLLPPTLFVHAQFTNPLGDTTIYELLVDILNAVIFILFPIIVLMIVYTGFLFVAAQGNEQKLQDARRALMFTVIGALVVLGAQALAFAICGTVQSLGVDMPAGTCD